MPSDGLGEQQPRHAGPERRLGYAGALGWRRAVEALVEQYAALPAGAMRIGRVRFDLTPSG